MRVLFVLMPGAGHVFPLVPLAWAFRSAGHDVMVGTCGEGLTPSVNAGLPVVDIAPGFQVQDYLRQLFTKDPGLPAQEHEAARHRQVNFAVILFGPVNRRLADGLLCLARDWQPDLVIYDELGAAGALAATSLNVPGIHHDCGFVRTRNLWRGLQETLADLYDEHGLTRPTEPAVTLDPAPPSMVSEPDGWSVRYVPYSGGAVLPDWLSERSGPRIAVSLGTVTPAVEGPGLMRRIVDVAAGLDAEFVLALGGRPPASLGDLPPNVRAFEWLPMNALLSTCDAIIHHGGAGTALTAAVAGVPQLVLPNGADRYHTADGVQKRGNGLAAEPDELDTSMLERLLSDRWLRVAAREVQAEVRALPSPAETVQRLTSMYKPLA
ncbi:nucleotide disphospho-sugar-binding domain-containing protein [Actinoplanes regularis]|uniref:nucleotide disphospho-sugar-binding domain-containing protein n=1 Tax=Actinoplanes regularis TaxID=52697 RepID=UPI0024A5D396|nr:nucleotide disphospho-sugar-binding domain-containing protein [Actinoplanes regularis]GLW33289.1 glycosyl transferase [Actinoplanes regularis]